MLLDIDTNTLPIEGEVLPKGAYNFIVMGIEMKKAKTGTNYLAIKLMVNSGPHKGFIVFDNVSLWHSDVSIVFRAKTRIASYIRATGLADVKPFDTNMLISKVVGGSITINGTGDNQQNNIIKIMSPLSDIYEDSDGDAPYAGLTPVDNGEHSTMTDW